MDTYWNLSDSERAALSESQVEALCQVELMEKGVLPPKELVLLPEEPVPLKTTALFGIEVPDQYGTYRPIPVAFATAEDATKFLECGPFERVSDWRQPEFYKVLGEGVAKVVSVSLASAPEVARRKSELDKLQSNKEANEKARREHRDSVDKAKKALEGLWEDYRRCQQDAASLQYAKDTWKKYLEMSGGDAGIARAFFRKAFSEEVTNEVAR